MRKLHPLLLAMFLLALFPGKAMAQTAVQEYYKNINLAELAICDSNFSKANDYYAAAFKINSKKAFYRDLKNAVFSAMDSRDYKLAEKYLSQMLSRGLDSETERKIRSNYAGDEQQKLNVIFGKHPNRIGVLRTNPTVIKLKQMVKWDQDVRQYYISEMQLDDYMTDSVFAVDAGNARQLLKLFKEKGMPDDAVNCETHYDIIIWHNTGADFGGYTSHIFDTILYKAVLTFDYDARQFAHVVGTSELSRSFRYRELDLHFPLIVMGSRYKDNVYLECYNDTSEQKINRERSKIGLEPLADLRKKLDASNVGLDTNSVLHKYSFRAAITTVVMETADDMKKWQQSNGKDAVVKRPFCFDSTEFLLSVGTIRGITIGRTKLGETLKLAVWYKQFCEGPIYFSGRKNGFPILARHCEGLVSENPNEDLATDIGRRNKARFVPGYHFFAEDGFNYPIKLINVEELFGGIKWWRDGVLIDTLHAGLWCKDTVPGLHTYILSQTLCGATTWDTVLVNVWALGIPPGP